MATPHSYGLWLTTLPGHCRVVGNALVVNSPVYYTEDEKPVIIIAEEPNK